VWQSPAAPVSLGARRVRRGGGRRLAMQTVAPLGMPDRCGAWDMEKARIIAISDWLHNPASLRRETINGARSALEAKIVKNAHGVGNPR
jgi:hypothetical protein